MNKETKVPDSRQPRPPVEKGSAEKRDTVPTALSNVFVSYAVNDQDFVRALDNSFQKKGKNIWIDWNRTSSGEAKEEEIQTRIRAADFFLLILSPDSMEFEPCLRELALAAELDRKLLCVLRRDVDAGSVPQALADAKTFALRQQDDFNKNFNALLKTIDTDLTLAIFISYSRRDQPFVNKLSLRLEKDRRKTWIDRKNIQHTEEWLNAIYSGIEASDNFVFILSPDGKWLIVGLASSDIQVVEIAKRELNGRLPKGHSSPVSSVAFSPDGHLLASGSWDSKIILWDIARLQQAGQALIGHTELVSSVCFSPDGLTLVSGSQDKTIILWDVATKKRIGEALIGHSAPVETVAFSPDGRVLASGGQDGKVIFWDVSVGSWKDKACRKANRNLTPEEWAQYFGDQPYRQTCAR